MTEGEHAESNETPNNFNLVRDPKHNVDVGQISVGKLQDAASRGVEVDITSQEPGSADVRFGDQGLEATQTRPGRIKADVTRVAVQGLPTKGWPAWIMGQTDR